MDVAENRDRLPTKQRALLERLTATLRGDERIVAAWVIGSLANGDGDSYSDVDLLVAVREERFGAIVADWPLFLEGLYPTVSARQLGTIDKPTISAITPEWLCFDITLASAADPRPHGYTAALLFTRDNPSPFTFAAPRAAITPDRLPDLVGAFLRILGLLPVVIGRGELIVGLAPVQYLRDSLIDLYLMENGSPRGGAKRLNSLLSEEQRHSLSALPPLAPTHDAIIESHLAIARRFLPRARRLAEQHGLAYPDAFERATLAHLQRTLGIQMSWR